MTGAVIATWVAYVVIGLNLFVGAIVIGNQVRMWWTRRKLRELNDLRNDYDRTFDHRRRVGGHRR